MTPPDRPPRSPIRARLTALPAAASAAVLGAVVVLVGAVCAGASSSSKSTSRHSATVNSATVCSGTAHRPGTLSGSYPGGAVIRGTCRVDAGPAAVSRNLTLDPGAVLLADYGINRRTHHPDSRLSVDGDVTVGSGATLILGCGGSDSPCADRRRVKSPARIGGSLIAHGALGVVIHEATIGGRVEQTGGGGGFSCGFQGVFARIKSPVYSDYEDSTVSGSLTIANLTSCWLGLARLHVMGSVTVRHDRLSDPDAIEIVSNTIDGNLACSQNIQVWDSTEQSPRTFPRRREANTVRGVRSGQCRLATPTHAGGASGPQPF
jgi:hypothetical protein